MTLFIIVDFLEVTIKVMFTLPACGLMRLPMMIYPYKRIPSEITKRLSVDWEVGHSPTGWLKAEVRYEYIGHVFTPLLGKHNVKFPDIFFISGHCTQQNIN